MFPAACRKSCGSASQDGTRHWQPTSTLYPTPRGVGQDGGSAKMRPDETHIQIHAGGMPAGSRWLSPRVRTTPPEPDSQIVCIREGCQQRSMNHDQSWNGVWLAPCRGAGVHGMTCPVVSRVPHSTTGYRLRSLRLRLSAEVVVADNAIVTDSSNK